MAAPKVTALDVSIEARLDRVRLLRGEVGRGADKAKDYARLAIALRDGARATCVVDDTLVDTARAFAEAARTAAATAETHFDEIDRDVRRNGGTVAIAHHHEAARRELWVAKRYAVHARDAAQSVQGIVARRRLAREGR